MRDMLHYLLEESAVRKKILLTLCASLIVTGVVSTTVPAEAKKAKSSGPLPFTSKEKANGAKYHPEILKEFGGAYQSPQTNYVQSVRRAACAFLFRRRTECRGAAEQLVAIWRGGLLVNSIYADVILPSSGEAISSMISCQVPFGFCPLLNELTSPAGKNIPE